MASGLKVPENRPALLSPVSFLVQVLAPLGLLSIPETCCQMSLKISHWGFNISEWNQLPAVIFQGPFFHGQLQQLSLQISVRAGGFLVQPCGKAASV